MADKTTAQQTLIKFAEKYENLIGSQETLVLLQFLTEFAQKNEVTILELKTEIEKDPETFIDMFRPESILKFKGIITAVKSGGISALMEHLM